MPADARFRVGLNAVLGALLAWLYGGDLSDVARAKASEVAALPSLPSVPFAAAALAAALVGLGLTLRGVVGKRDKGFRGYRVMPIVAVVVLFVDLLVLQADKTPFPSNLRAAAAIDAMGQLANRMATYDAVPTIASLEQGLVDVGPAPWLSKGEPIAAWKWASFDGCTGPKQDVLGLPAGTMVYCVDAAGKTAWITAVGLPFEQRFGAAGLVTRGGAPLVVEVRPAPKLEDPAAGPPAVPTVADPDPDPELPFGAAVDADAGN